MQLLLGRLVTDPALLRRFARDPDQLLDALVSEGLELSAIECAALAATELSALRRLARGLDGRLRRAALDSTPTRRRN